MRGNNGDNIINGGDGNDELTGRGGADSFLFDTPLDAAFNVDVITDFNVADDTIRREHDLRRVRPRHALGRRVRGRHRRAGCHDRIIYNNATGALFYDSDGSAAQPPSSSPP